MTEDMKNFARMMETSHAHYEEKLTPKNQGWRLQNKYSLYQEMLMKVEHISLEMKQDPLKEIELTWILSDLAMLCQQFVSLLRKEDEEATLLRMTIESPQGIKYPPAYLFDGLVVLDWEDVKEFLSPELFRKFEIFMWGQTMVLGPNKERLVHADDYRRFALNLPIID